MNDDLHLIERVIAGDADSFRALVRRHEKPLFCLIRNLIRDRAEVEDIAQEVFLTAYVHLRAYAPHRAAFSTWLLTIARNKCLNALKKKRPQTIAVVPDRADGRTPDAEAAGAELRQRLDACLDALPFEQKLAFILAEIQGLSHEEIARIQGVKLGTVKSRISRAREKLRCVVESSVEQP